MSEKAHTFTLVTSRWAKTLIHSHFSPLDEQNAGYIHTFQFSINRIPDTFNCSPLDEQNTWYIHAFHLSMSTIPDTFAFFTSRWAQYLIHSHCSPLDEHNTWYIHTFQLSMSTIPDTFARRRRRFLKIRPCPSSSVSLTNLLRKAVQIIPSKGTPFAGALQRIIGNANPP